MQHERIATSTARAAERIEVKGRRGLAIQADSADVAAVKRSVDEAVAGLGGLDILVNNAGIARYGAVAEIDLADLDALLNVNVRAVVLASFAARLLENGKAAKRPLLPGRLTTGGGTGSGDEIASRPEQFPSMKGTSSRAARR